MLPPYTQERCHWQCEDTVARKLFRYKDKCKTIRPASIG
jgi:hypothetical protein